MQQIETIGEFVDPPIRGKYVIKQRSLLVFYENLFAVLGGGYTKTIVDRFSEHFKEPMDVRVEFSHKTHGYVMTWYPEADDS